MYYVYKFLDKNNNVIYVGKSKQDLEQRFRRHLHLPEECYNLCHTIEYIECPTESDMSIKEIYYINKYRANHNYFNLLDIADIPTSIEFNDSWAQYRGPLGSQFHQSINYVKGYSTEKSARYKKDGTLDCRKCNKKSGINSFVEGLNEEEVSLIIDYFVSEINNAHTTQHEQIYFRNLVIFILGLNIPHKANELLAFKYRDLFNENDYPKSINFRLNRSHKDEVITIPLKSVVTKTLLSYVKRYDLNFKTNADDSLFKTRKKQVLSSRTWWKILNDAATSAGITKNIGSETLRKTYGLHIFNVLANKLGALLFLGEIWGQQRDYSIIKYLNLIDNEVDFNYYLGESFSLGEFDLSNINCLRKIK